MPLNEENKDISKLGDEQIFFLHQKKANVLKKIKNEIIDDLSGFTQLPQNIKWLNNKDFNDVDALFITNKPQEVTKFCLNLSKIRTKPVVPLILKKEDLIKEIKNKKEVVLNILKTGIILIGESVFIEVLKNVKQ